MKEGRFDIAESQESCNKSSKVDMIKNVAIVVLAIVVLGLAVKIAVSNGSSGEVDSSGGDFGSKRPLPPPSNSKNRNGNDICMNEQCINAADSLFEHMNLDVSLRFKKSMFRLSQHAI